MWKVEIEATRLAHEVFTKLFSAFAPQVVKMVPSGLVGMKAKSEEASEKGIDLCGGGRERNQFMNVEMLVRQHTLSIMVLSLALNSTILLFFLTTKLMMLY